MSTRLHTVHVDLSETTKDRSYPIHIGRDLLTDGALLASILGARDVVLVSNDTVAPLYMERVRQSLGAKGRVIEVILPDGEEFKTLASWAQILDAALAGRCDRHTVMIALGGGVIGDLVGYAAASFLRGVDFIQLPTTLLAQVDSSVGGKTGLNHPAGKNMIGAFHQPIAVLIDLQTLHTLPSREYAAGLAEIIKYGLIRDPDFFLWLEQASDRLLAREESALAEAIERSCAIKAEVVAADELEGGLRAILNFGHTFGHAIEKHQGYGSWLHGEAVACGMLLAARISAARGWIDHEVVARLTALLRHVNLPITPPQDMSTAVFLDAMMGDKKTAAGKIRYILLAELGRATLVDDVQPEEIAAALAV
jgi:3-dehydroquinate synthase